MRYWRNLAALMPYANRVTGPWVHARGIGWIRIPEQRQPPAGIPAQRRRDAPPGMPGVQPRTVWGRRTGRNE